MKCLIQKLQSTRSSDHIRSYPIITCGVKHRFAGSLGPQARPVTGGASPRLSPEVGNVATEDAATTNVRRQTPLGSPPRGCAKSLKRSVSPKVSKTLVQASRSGVYNPSSISECLGPHSDRRRLSVVLPGGGEQQVLRAGRLLRRVPPRVRVFRRALADLVTGCFASTATVKRTEGKAPAAAKFTQIYGYQQNG